MAAKKSTVPLWCLVAVVWCVVGASEKKMQLNLVSMSSIGSDNKIVLQSLIFSNVDGKSYVNSTSRNYVEVTNDWKIVVTVALCSDSVNENVCDYLFEDIEIDNVCELIKDTGSNVEIYYESSRLDTLECPLKTGDYSFYSGDMVHRFMSYVPMDKPFILMYVKALNGFDIMFKYKLYIQATEVE